ncbi:HdeD family acid-resistance protein [Actinophytocola sp.]|uniref:HdeD family acid-resistance protein n=1 Tax=Actinophytocola sp. TaxID=1872138 RepID=UPI002ED0189F
MLELLARRWQLVVLRGVVAVLFGVLAIAWPEITVLALALLFGAYTLLDGVAALVMGIGRGTDRGYMVALGVLGVLAGVIALVWPQITVIALLVIIAVWAIFAGVTQIAAAVRLRKVIRNEWFLALSGVVVLVLGLLLIVQPAEGAIALITAIAAFALAWGIVLIVLGMRLRALGKASATAGPLV